MEALLRAINKILIEKDDDINMLKWENERLKAEIKDLKKDIEKYKENEAKEAKDGQTERAEYPNT